ncbi:hypothetical protein VCHA50O393_40337 [Vibrio chagasii]|nr:hypothetical protein VCHA53O474_11093 [Vibrio chagasii]CAH7306802.1 hypothetical protein VCHA50O393_40337 [Vibrio chagasii]
MKQRLPRSVLVDRCFVLKIESIDIVINLIRGLHGEPSASRVSCERMNRKLERVTTQ